MTPSIFHETRNGATTAPVSVMQLAEGDQDQACDARNKLTYTEIQDVVLTGKMWHLETISSALLGSTILYIEL